MVLMCGALRTRICIQNLCSSNIATTMHSKHRPRDSPKTDTAMKKKHYTAMVERQRQEEIDHLSIKICMKITL